MRDWLRQRRPHTGRGVHLLDGTPLPDPDPVVFGSHTEWHGPDRLVVVDPEELEAELWRRTENGFRRVERCRARRLQAWATGPWRITPAGERVGGGT